MATADWVQTNGFGLVLWMTRRGRLQHNSFLDVDLQRPSSFAWFFPEQYRKAQPPEGAAPFHPVCSIDHVDASVVSPGA
jgi:hypothetical protein